MQGETVVVVEILEVFDPEAMQAYQADARVQILERGGSVLARGGKTFEGPVAGPMLLQRWPSEAAFTDWQSSAEYQPLLERRNKAARLQISILPCT